MDYLLCAAVSLDFLLYLPTSMNKRFKVCPLGKARTEKKVPGTFRFSSLTLPSRNTLHTDQVALAIHSAPTHKI